MTGSVRRLLLCMTTMNATSRYDEDDDGLDSEEEEEERLLSEQHGEATDDSKSKRKRGAWQGGARRTELTEEDAAAAKEFEEKMRRKKPRPVLGPADLKSNKGLIFVRRSFPTTVKKMAEAPLASRAQGVGARSNELARKLNTEAQIKAAAAYSRSLISAYKSFAQELFPSLAVEDVFLKIEDLGSKKEVKDYLQIMRDEVRREHLVSIYGEEKAVRLLSELEHGLKVHPMDERLARGEGNEAEAGATLAPRIGRAVDSDEEGETETPPASPPENVANPYAKKAASPKRRVGLEDSESAAPNGTDEAMVELPESEDEAEATFSVSGEHVSTAAKNAEREDGKSIGEEEHGVPAEEEASDESTPKPRTQNSPVEAVVAEKRAAAPNDTDDAMVELPESEEEAETTFSVNEKHISTATKNIERGEGGNAEEEASDESTPKPRTQQSSVEAVGAEKRVDEVDESAGATEEVEETCEAPGKERGFEPTPEECNGGDLTENFDAGKENKEGETASSPNIVAKTQETLTLVGSQLDGAEMGGFTQEGGSERFSQVSTTVEGEAGPTRGAPRPTREEDWRLSQPECDAADDDERFSQFTQGTVERPVFEEENDEDANGDAKGGDPLGQTMGTQLSMEY